MIDTGRPPAHIPPGVADYFWNEAAQRRQLEYKLLELCRAWGYSDIIPPTLEYADTLAAASNAAQQALIHRFQDNDGHTLALRYDMTLAIARLMGTRLHDAPMPQRFCYTGSVFRHGEPLAGQQREFWQAGVELIGANSPEADGEILALTAKALQAAGLHDFRLALGQIRYFHGMLHALALDPAAQALLQRAIVRKSEPDLDEFLAHAQPNPEQRATVEGFLALAGSEDDGWDSVLTAAASLCLNDEMHVALENLRAIRTVLDAYDVAHYLHLDLTEVRSLGYYTGITFQALVPGLGQAVAGGGRYDNLIGIFGPAQPAVGVALGLERILLARKIQADEQNGALEKESNDYAPDILVSTNGSAACYQLIEAWRQQGIRAAIDVNGSDASSLWGLAQQSGVPRVLVWTGSGFNVYDDLEQVKTSTTLVSESDIQSYISGILQAKSKQAGAAS